MSTYYHYHGILKVFFYFLFFLSYIRNFFASHSIFNPFLNYSSLSHEICFRLYLGVGKVGPLMKWAQEHSSTHFELPNMPHLNNEQKVLFKQQVREREEDLELRRREDSRAMAAEDRAQKEMKRKRKNELKTKRAAEEAQSTDERTAEMFNSEAKAELTSDIIIKSHQSKEITESIVADLEEDENKQTSPRKKDGEGKVKEFQDYERKKMMEGSLNEEL